MGEKVDSNYFVETPEGIRLSMRIASSSVRMMAFVIDFFIRIFIWIGGVLVLSSLNLDAYWGLLLLYLFVLWWFYPVLFEVYYSGMTPGKKIMKIRVLHGNGTPVAWRASMIRNFLRLSDFAMAWGLEFICMLFDPRNRRLGDLAADTIVVYCDKQKHKIVLPDAPAELPALVLSSDEQKSFISFGERFHTLSQERQIELAEILEPLHEEKGKKAMHKLYSYSVGLAGGEEES